MTKARCNSHIDHNTEECETVFIIQSLNQPVESNGRLFWKGTSRQRSGKGNQKEIPTPKTEVGQKQTNNQALIP